MTAGVGPPTVSAIAVSLAIGKKAAGPLTVFRLGEVYFFWLNVRIARIRLAKENIAIKVSNTVIGIPPFLRG